MNVGVVGVGHLGQHHARLYASMPGVNLVGVVDRDAARGREIAARHGCEADTDVEWLFGKVQAASVAVPTEHHLPVARALLAQGIHVLVEKPLARTMEEADGIVEAGEQAGCQVMVGHSERFNPAVAALSRAVDAPRFFEIHRLAAFTARSTDIDVVLDLMIHDLDLLLYLDGTRPVAVDAVGVAALTDRFDIANARIRFESGCVANVTASRISAEGLRRIRIFQSRTYLSCDTGKRQVERYRVRQDESGTPKIEHDLLPVDDSEPLANELEAFVDAVRNGKTPPVDGKHGRRVLELAQRVHRAIRSEPDTP